MKCRSVQLVIAFLGVWSAHAQLVLDPKGLVVLPPGQWADTVLLSYDPLEPVGSFYRVEQTGEIHTTHMVLKDHPVTMFRRVLGLGGPNDTTQGTLYLKVNGLKFSDQGDRSICALHAEVLERSAEGYRRRFEFSAMAPTEVSDRSMASCEQGLLNALRSFFDAYVKATRDSLGVPQADTMSEITAQFDITPANTPILTISKPKRGIFWSFMDMRLNKPDTSFQFDIRGEDLEYVSAERLSLSNVPDRVLNSIWGLSSGKRLYIREATEFIRLEPEDKGFHAYVQFPGTVVPLTVLGGGLLFGAIGGAVIGAMSSEPGPRVRFDLDMLTGNLVMRDSSMITMSYSQHVFWLSRFSEPGTTVKTSCARGGERTLGKGQWTSFVLSPKYGDDQVVLSTQAGDVVVNVPSNSDHTHVHLVSVKKDGVLKVTELKDQMRYTALRDLEAKDRVH